MNHLRASSATGYIYRWQDGTIQNLLAFPGASIKKMSELRSSEIQRYRYRINADRRTRNVRTGRYVTIMKLARLNENEIKLFYKMNVCMCFLILRI